MLMTYSINSCNWWNAQLTFGVSAVCYTSCFSHFRFHLSSSVQGSCTGFSVHMRVCACVCVFAVVCCAVKFLRQRKSSLNHLRQTRCDSVHRRPNRAPIQPLQLDPPSSHRVSSQRVLPGLRKEGGSAPWKNTSHVPVWAEPDASFCYNKIKFTEKKGNILVDDRGARRTIPDLGYGVSCRAHFLNWGPEVPLIRKETFWWKRFLSVTWEKWGTMKWSQSQQSGQLSFG